MATTVKISLDKRRSKKDKTYPLVMRITHNSRSTISIALSYYVLENDWDNKFSRIKNSYEGTENVGRLNNYFRKQQAKAIDIVTQLQDSGEILRMTVKQIKERIENKSSKFTFYKYTDKVIEEFKEANRVSYASSMTDMLRAVKRFKRGADIKFEQIDYTFLKGFETFHLSKGNSINSLGVYMRNLRAIYNRAIKEGNVKREFYPFDNYSIKREKTKKRAVRKEVIQKIETVELPYGQRVWHAKNYFLFSFYGMGMNFIDMAFLKISNITNSRLEYKRNKTKKIYNMLITERMWEILDQYIDDKEDDDYIFPIIKKTGNPTQLYREMEDKRRIYNKKLKEIAKLCKIEENLTSYVSRHSWATIGKRAGVPIAVISEGLGHSNLEITEVYLDCFDKEVLDDYNKLITG